MVLKAVVEKISYGSGSQTGKLEMKLKRAHKCLKVIELIGFCGHEIEAEFIWYIINNTVSLEKIIIDPNWRPLQEECDIYWMPKANFEAVRTCARQLGKSLPPGLEVVIL
ncbi:hypothetical protein CRYUN_Cryun15aG0041200 [Craigia yunnanensis]